MDRVKVMRIMEMFYPDVRQKHTITQMILITIHAVATLNGCCLIQPKDQWITELIADEYLGTSVNQVKNHDVFTKLFGDAMFTIPALTKAGFHSSKFGSQGHKVFRASRKCNSWISLDQFKQPLQTPTQG